MDNDMDDEYDKKMQELVNDLDVLILKYQDDFAPHNITAILLSRVTLLMSHDPECGKGLIKFVWERLDELEQSNPGQYL
jgi:hypothetical protein